MPARLPDPPGHEALLSAIARLAAGDGPALWVLPGHFADPPGGAPRMAPDATPPGTGHACIIALDLWSEAEAPEPALARLRGALAPSGQLILVQTNWPQRRGTVPPAAGGPRRSPDFYSLRSALARCWPEARPGLAMLDHGLQLHPVGADGVARAAQAAPLDAVAFVAAEGLAPAQGPAPPGAPARGADLAEVSPTIARGARRRLAFVIDVPDWAYANIVDHIAPHLAGRYEVTRFFIADHPDRATLLSQLFVEDGFDHIHFMWRELWFNTLAAPALLARLLEAGGITAATLAHRLAAPVITTTVYDHLFLTPDEVAARRLPLALTDGFSTASPRLADLYLRQFGRAPDAVTPDGVDTRFFAPRPQSPGPQPRRDGPLRVGWVGNSGWGKDRPGMGADPKGLHSILTPALDLLRAEGHAVELVLADRNLRRRDRDEMRAYYADEIDVLACASLHEGTPNPVLEAMASGRAWVSTDVGIVAEVAGPVQSTLILPARSPEAMAATLRRLLQTPDLRTKAEAENAARAAALDWPRRVADWTRLFAAAEARHAATHAALREAVLLTRLRAPDMPAPPRPQRSRESQPPATLSGAQARIEGLEGWLDEALDEVDRLQNEVAMLRSGPGGWTLRRFLRALRRRLPGGRGT